MLILKLKMLCGHKSIRASIDIGVYLEKVYDYSQKAISPFTVSTLERFIVNHLEIQFKRFA